MIITLCLNRYSHKIWSFWFCTIFPSNLCSFRVGSFCPHSCILQFTSSFLLVSSQLWSRCKFILTTTKCPYCHSDICQIGCCDRVTCYGVEWSTPLLVSVKVHLITNNRNQLEKHPGAQGKIYFKYDLFKKTYLNLRQGVLKDLGLLEWGTRAIIFWFCFLSWFCFDYPQLFCSNRL